MKSQWITCEDGIERRADQLGDHYRIAADDSRKQELREERRIAAAMDSPGGGYYDTPNEE